MLIPLDCYGGRLVLREVQVFVNHSYGDGTFAYGGGDALGGSVSGVAYGEDAGRARFEWQGLALCVPVGARGIVAG